MMKDHLGDSLPVLQAEENSGNFIRRVLDEAQESSGNFVLRVLDENATPKPRIPQDVGALSPKAFGQCTGIPH